MSELLDSEIKFLPGVGPKRAELLEAEAGIHTFRDLHLYFPYKYIDKTRFYKVRELDTDMQYIQLRGKIRRFQPRVAEGVLGLQLISMMRQGWSGWYGSRGTNGCSTHIKSKKSILYMANQPFQRGLQHSPP